MAKSSPKEYTFHWEDSKPIQFDLHAPSTYSPSISTYKALILYHSGGLVSANRRFARLPSFARVRSQDIYKDAEALGRWLLSNHKEIGVDPERVATGDASSGSFVAILSFTAWKTIHPKASLNIYCMIDTSSAWYNTPKDSQATVFWGMVPLAIIGPRDYEHFLEPGHSRICDDQSNPMDIMGRPGLFLSLLKEGMSPKSQFRGLHLSSLTNLVAKSPPSFNGISVLTTLTSSFPPTMSIHGWADSSIPLSESRAALDKLGVANELLVGEGTEHGLAPVESRGEELEKAVWVVGEVGLRGIQGRERLLLGLGTGFL